MPLQRFFLTALFLLPLLSDNANETLQELSLPELEQRRAAIDVELKQLANFSLRGEVGSNGYRSPPTMEANRSEWIEVGLGQEISIDEIVLTPTLVRSTTGIQSEGFPIAFRILAGSENDKEGSVIASFTEQDQLLPRIAPLLVPCPGTVASWVRIEATRLSSRSYDGKYALQLSELLVFSGSKNYALRRPVSGPQPDLYPINSWKLPYLTDGAVPYLMNAATGQKSVAYIRSTYIGENIGKPTSLTIDLNGVHDVSEITLHAVEQSDTIPQSTSGNAGIPRHLQVEGATRPDFSDAVLLLDARHKTLYDISPIISWNIVPATPCRYVRLTALEPYIVDNGLRRRTRIGFAEIELFAEGRNVALGKPVIGNFEHATKDSPLAALTDGRNFYGNILSIREWMHQLARRHNLEKERPIIATRLAELYKRQKTNLRRVAWLAALLGAVTVIILLVEKAFRLRAIYQTRERIAANLHDELGANLNAIGLLGDYAKNLIEEANKQEPLQELSEVVTEIRSLTEETGETARHCTNLLEAKGHHEDLIEDINRTSARLLADMEHKITFNHEYMLAKLPHQKRFDLALFYKECLNNIVRHANATEVITNLTGTRSSIYLTIQDNGRGLAAGSKPQVPASIKRRAKLAGGNVQVTTPPEGGTLVALRIRTRRFFSNRQKTDSREPCKKQRSC